MLPCAGAKLESVGRTLSEYKEDAPNGLWGTNLDSESPYRSNNIQPTTEDTILIGLQIVLPHALLTLHKTNLGDHCHEVFNGELNDVTNTPRMI